jgi:hypothetical protein
MKPPLPHSESAVPKALHVRLAIADAIRKLTATDENEAMRQRRAELTSVRRELEAIKLEFQKAGEECLVLVKVALRATLTKKYNPDQPRSRWAIRMVDSGQAKVRQAARRKVFRCLLPVQYLNLRERGYVMRRWKILSPEHRSTRWAAKQVFPAPKPWTH